MPSIRKGQLNQKEVIRYSGKGVQSISGKRIRTKKGEVAVETSFEELKFSSSRQQCQPAHEPAKGALPKDGGSAELVSPPALTTKRPSLLYFQGFLLRFDSIFGDTWSRHRFSSSSG
jgi:hypothetical protein